MMQQYVEFFKMLSGLQPSWIALILVLCILSFKAPQVIRELFAGVRGLTTIRNQKPTKGAKQTK
jgi:hypothetical protein